ncbi:MAG: hypothetical protein M1815_005685 [Lichina confinis]|nr:MAG: hypothetical protein M1815_005685 [Lichina confinis]
MAEAAGLPRPPELDEALYQLEVLKLERGQWDEKKEASLEGDGGEEDDESDGENDDDNDEDDGAIEHRRLGLSREPASVREHGQEQGPSHPPSGLEATSDPESTYPRRSDSLITIPSPNMRSVSPSNDSRSTVATSRSSYEQRTSAGSHRPSLRPSLWAKSPSTATPTTTTTGATIGTSNNNNATNSRCESFTARAEQQPQRQQLQQQRSGPATAATPPVIASSTPPASPTGARKSLLGFKRKFERLSKGRKSKTLAKKPVRCVMLASPTPEAKKSPETINCSRCQTPTKKCGSLHELACQHSYCHDCFKTLMATVMRTAKTVPVTCCRQPVPAGPLKHVLTADEQERFAKLVLDLDANRRQQSGCPGCQTTLLEASAPDLRSAWNGRCPNCHVDVCKMCASKAHAAAEACSGNWTLDVLGEVRPGQVWIRCRPCGEVNSNLGGTFITCLCGTDICDACGSRWGEVTGCDAACDASAAAFGPSASAVAVDAAAGPASTVDPPCPVDFARHIEVTLAQARGLDHPELREVRTRQLEEQKRFLLFEQKQKWTMWTRHGQLRVDMSDRHAELERSLQAKHIGAATAMEDRHLMREMELQEQLEQEERACVIRLRHMEDYFNLTNASAHAHANGSADANANANATSNADASKDKGAGPLLRRITERDVRELNSQYRLRDDMSRLHEARINVLRDQQGRKLEALAKRQRQELESLGTSLEKEVEALEAAVVARDEATFEKLFRRRRAIMKRRWTRDENVIRTELELTGSERLRPLPPITWPNQQRGRDQRRTRQSHPTNTGAVRDTTSLGIAAHGATGVTPSSSLRRAFTAPTQGTAS